MPTYEEEAAKKSITDQQSLLLDISKNIIKDDVEEILSNILRLTGHFLGVEKIYIKAYNKTARLLELRSEWHSESLDEKFCRSSYSTPFSEGMPLYELLITQNAKNILCDDADSERFHGVMRNGEMSYMAFPIHKADSFWGMLAIVQFTQKRDWSLNDAHWAEFIRNTIASVVERNRTEEDLLRMSTFVNGSPNCICLINSDGAFEYFNQSIIDISGYSGEELKQHGISILFDMETNQHIIEHVFPKIFENIQYEFELPLIRKDGETRFMSFSTFLLNLSTFGIGIIASDTTEKRRMETELIEAKEQAVQSNQAKSDFLSRMSHEIRTPMNAIIGMAHIARESNDPEKKEYCLGKIEGASRHLLGIINDILDMSKIEADKFELSCHVFQTEKLIADAMSVIHFQADENHQCLTVHIDGKIPKAVIGDGLRLTQIITNLLSNAVKFTPKGGNITFEARLLSRNGRLLTLQMEVIDSGIGITAEQQSRLFAAFEQAERGTSRKYGGTGLGLAISKRIVELMGGRIWVESEVGKGSKFAFTIQCEVGNEEDFLLSSDIDTPADRENDNYQDHTILIAEDVEINREIMAEILKPTGVTVAFANNGAEAVSMFKAHMERYSMILMDIHMPEMDGYEATKAIRGMQGAKARTIPIIAMTADAFQEDADKSIRIGMNGHMSKPINREHLFSVLQKHLSAI